MSVRPDNLPLVGDPIALGLPEFYGDVAAVLLAGGNSLRMGRDKALLKLEGSPIIKVLSDRLRLVTDEVLLSANDPAAYAFLELPVIPDIFSGCGPMAGLHAAMRRTLRPWILVLACDLPGVTESLLQQLIVRTADYDAVVPCTSDGCLHPLCAIYKQTCLPTVERNLIRGVNGMLAIFEDPKLRVLRLNPNEGGFRDADLININSPHDFHNYLRLHKS